MIQATFMGFLYVRTIAATGVGRLISPKSYAGAVFHGINCGLMVGVLLGMVIFPSWMYLVGYPDSPPVPDFRVPDSFILMSGHVIYGLIVAFVYAVGRYN